MIPLQSRASILVLGDSMLDVYAGGRVERAPLVEGCSTTHLIRRGAAGLEPQDPVTRRG
jgi:bifunctional ADP-heptose synthase (sugar kinase/adenylyltransferase)